MNDILKNNTNNTNNEIDYKTKNGMIVLNSLVRFLLSTEPELRDSDLKLFKRIYEIYRVDVYNTSFDDILGRIARNEVPAFESIRRSRQKIQEYNPELRSSIQVQNQKDNIETEFREFALGE